MTLIFSHFWPSLFKDAEAHSLEGSAGATSFACALKIEGQICLNLSILSFATQPDIKDLPDMLDKEK